MGVDLCTGQSGTEWGAYGDARWYCCEERGDHSINQFEEIALPSRGHLLEETLKHSFSTAFIIAPKDWRQDPLQNTVDTT